LREEEGSGHAPTFGAYGKAGNGNGNGNENGNGNGNSCTVVSNHWTGRLDLPILSFLVRAETKRAYYLSFLESVYVKGHVHI